MLFNIWNEIRSKATQVENCFEFRLSAEVLGQKDRSKTKLKTFRRKKDEQI